MHKFLLAAAFSTTCITATAQNIHHKLDSAVKHLLADGQMKHALLGFHVTDNKTNKVVYDINGQTGLAPASTQKIFTSIAALDILGSDYTYKTAIGYNGEIKGDTLAGDLIITGHGDPSFGSWRYAHTKMDSILQQLAVKIQAAGIHIINGNLILDDTQFSYQPIPGGWIWEDIGNYYGAGTWGINWNENQYDLTLKPGEKEGEETEVISTKPAPELRTLNNFITTGAAGSGDNGYIYIPPYSTEGFTEGTIPAGEKSFTISGSLPYPSATLAVELKDKFINSGIKISGSIITGAQLYTERKKPVPATHSIFTYYSPSLDSLIYWFLQKSINLYGEAFAKTIAYEKKGLGSTDEGVGIIRNFWAEKGIDKSAVKMIDGSGLSPQNRVTANAEVQALQYAKTRSWFHSFYNSLPVYNGMKMKSGTIGGAKAFAGYQTSADGHEYTFSIIINNYEGSADSVVHKMFGLLNLLK